MINNPETYGYATEIAFPNLAEESEAFPCVTLLSEDKGLDQFDFDHTEKGCAFVIVYKGGSVRNAISYRLCGKLLRRMCFHFSKHEGNVYTNSMNRGPSKFHKHLESNILLDGVLQWSKLDCMLGVKKCIDPTDQFT